MICTPGESSDLHQNTRVNYIKAGFVTDDLFDMITLSFLYRYGRRTHGIFEKLGIPGPKPLMYLGTVGRLNPVSKSLLILFLNLNG